MDMDNNSLSNICTYAYVMFHIDFKMNYMHNQVRTKHSRNSQTSHMNWIVHAKRTSSNVKLRTNEYLQYFICWACKCIRI